MGLRFKMKYDGTAQVMEEIRRVVPIYRDVVIGSRDGESIWDASRSPLATAPVDGTAAAPVVIPIRTAGLDVLDARFESWFDGLFNAAEKQRAPAV